MKQESLNFPEAIEGLSLITIEGGTLSLWTPFGDYIQKSIGPTSSIYIRLEIDSNGSVVGNLREFPLTAHSSHLATSAANSSLNSTGLLTKYSLAILISLSLWAILLYGLFVDARVLASFVGLLCLAAIALAATRSSPPTILPPSSASGETDQPPSST